MNKWKDKYEIAKAAYSAELALMERSQSQYDGTMQPTSGKKTTTLYNATKELIETTIDSQIPMPKVEPNIPTEKNKKLARIIEDMLRFEVKRLRLAENNDEDERSTRVLGGQVYFTEWNNLIKTHNTVGATNVRMINARQFIPQTNIHRKEYMDYFFFDFEVTKDSIKKKYGIDVSEESMDAEKGTDVNDDMVTQHYCFYRNGNTTGCYSWVGDTDIINDPKYQQRGKRVCSRCGLTKSGNKCSCGSTKFEKRNLEFEELTRDIVRSDGVVIPEMSWAKDDEGNIRYREVEVPETTQDLDETGNIVEVPVFEQEFDDKMNVIGEKQAMRIEEEPYMEKTKIPYYYPKGFPICVRKNVSSSNRFMGNSDAEMIYEIQDKMNKVSTRMIDKLMKAGSIMKKPKNVNFNFNNEEQVVEFENMADAQGIGVINITFDINSDVQMMAYLYNTAKSMLGISDTFQGKADTTAKSGIAKEIQVQRALGRQESKSIMKNAAYSDLYRQIFEYNLAYADEPRHFESQTDEGEVEEGVFNRYDFLEQDEYGNWYYNDEFTFTTDSQGSSAENRQYVLQTMEMDFKSGLYGDPQNPESILQFWKDRETQNYPNAKRQVARWQKKVQEQKEKEEMMQQQLLEGGGQNEVPNLQGDGIDGGLSYNQG